MGSERGEPVDLYVYDLTHGMASLLSPAILGHQIEGVWHTAVVVYGREYFFGGDGITSCAPGSTQLGAPLRVERLGETFVPLSLFLEYVQGLAGSSYTGSSYNLLDHNCNNFSDEVSQFLCGARLPKHILELPERALTPPLRDALQSLLTGMQGSAGQPVSMGGVRHSRGVSPDYVTLNSQIEEASVADASAGRSSAELLVTSPLAKLALLVPALLLRDNALVRALRALLRHFASLRLQDLPHARQQSAALDQRRSTLADKLARKERRKEKKRNKLRMQGGGGEGELEEEEMAEAVDVARAGPSGSEGSLQLEAEERRQNEEARRSREPPLVYKDIDGAVEFERLSASLSEVQLSPEERNSLEELQQYLVHGEGSWALGDDFLTFIGRLLNDESVGVETRSRALRCLAACALRDDVSLLLHQDRRDHTIVNYAYNIDRLSLEEQRGIALFMCNLFENVSSSEWLLYISEWQHRGQPLANIRVTTKVSVHSLLSADPELRDIGTALMHNVAIKEVKTVRFLIGKSLRDLLPRGAKSKVFDDVCVELAMALLQFVSELPAEEHLYRACRALARLAQHSHDVPQLCQVLAVRPEAFRGTSPRIDEQIDILMTKVK